MIITITGKSGSGKGFISNQIKSLNKKVVYLDIDKIGHESINDSKIKEKLCSKFNLKLIDGKIDRKELGTIVFNDRDKMKQLSLLTYKYIEKKINCFINKNKDKIVILDWALIPKTKFFRNADVNILVDTPKKIRMERAIKRDNISKEKFEEREKAAMKYNKKEFDYIIKNTNTSKLMNEVNKLYEESIISWKF